MVQAGQKGVQVAITVIAVILVVATCSVASSVFAPIAFSLFLIALVWPVQSRLEGVMPGHAALALTFLAVVLIVLGLGLLTAWAVGQVARWLVADAGRLQQIYEQTSLWLEERGIVLAVLWSENVSVGWLLRTTQTISSRLNSTLSFWVVTLVYVLLGLLEVRDFERRIGALRNERIGSMLLRGATQTALKIRRYMVIRTAMSVITGVLVWFFARQVGLPLAEEWGFIAFTLNYIPFLGPLVATLLPTILALTQFDSWTAVLTLFVGLNLIQFIVGSYIEPRVAGDTLSMSPALVLFSVFLWGYLWGIFGAFIGVPISIAVLSFCSQHPASKWIADLFGSSEPAHVEENRA